MSQDGSGFFGGGETPDARTSHLYDLRMASSDIVALIVSEWLLTPAATWL